jgi:DNA-binding transcriptional LysR family regulator
MIELNRLIYFITVVDNDFNLTKSAKILHISQPALSTSMKNLGRDHRNKIFVRDRGRIVGLTHAGMNLVQDARRVYADYNYMMTRLDNNSRNQIKGTLRLGISSVINATVFSNALIDFLEQNNNINVIVTEGGSFDLQKQLVDEKLDLVVGISPATNSGLTEHILLSDDTVIWFNERHRFSKFTGAIPLSELSKEKIITLNDSFMITYQLRQLFDEQNIKPNFFLQTTSWGLIVNACQLHDDLVGVLARPVEDSFPMDGLQYREFSPYLPWQIALYENDAISQGNTLIEFARKWFLDYFNNARKLNDQWLDEDE